MSKTYMNMHAIDHNIKKEGFILIHGAFDAESRLYLLPKFFGSFLVYVVYDRQKKQYNVTLKFAAAEFTDVPTDYISLTIVKYKEDEWIDGLARTISNYSAGVINVEHGYEGE